MSMLRHPYVYILANRKEGVLYIGVTSNLVRRLWEHKNGTMEGFTKRYGLSRLVWFEEFKMMNIAIQREKRLKKWNRAWKIH